MTPLWLLVLLCSPLRQPVSVESWGVSTVPSESECRPYIEKALKERSPQEAVDTTGSEQVPSPTSSDDQEGTIEETEEDNTRESKEEETDDESHTEGDEVSTETGEVTDTEEIEKSNEIEGDKDMQGDAPDDNENSEEIHDSTAEKEAKSNESIEEAEEGNENSSTDQPSVEDGSESVETGDNTTQPKPTSTEENEDDDNTAEEQSTETPDEATTEERSEEETKNDEETTDDAEHEIASDEEAATGEDLDENKQGEAEEKSVEKVDISEETILSSEDQGGEESVEVPGGEVTESEEVNESLEVTESAEINPSEELKVDETETTEDPTEEDTNTTQDSEEESSGTTETSVEEPNEKEALAEEEIEAHTEEVTETLTSTEETSETTEDSSPVTEDPSEEAKQSSEASAEVSIEETVIESSEDNDKNGTVTNDSDQDSKEEQSSREESSGTTEEQENVEEGEIAQEQEPTIEDQLTLEFEAPKVRRSRDHITEILRLSPEAAETELMLAKTIESTLKELKKLYDAAIKPLEILFKYRDLSNRHFGDPEIFSKPLILFMGPWSGGKSTILNYLLDNEFKSSSLRTGAEPSPAYFNILMWGEREEILDGTQLAADWTFSGLQKFGQGLLDRLRGLKLNSPLLEKVNIVEIPGILEIRKQVERLFPFNDACQWFIDRADIIFLVYDPSKLDVGPETEAILDQLKGREYQTRIILNKADQVKPEELMRVQGTLIWNISPLMSSTEPPVMYSTSLWSIPYEQGAPSRLLHAQERAFLRDLRQAIDKRVENKIASARRFAVRVRNHAKMVDCYLTTYYNHKSFFGNRKKVADDIIEQPQNYHIYEGLSTLTNISRYDLPDPEVYRDFFRLNPLYDFQRLSDTCTYFRGCPINRLDVAIAYDLPELVGKYKKQAEKVLETVAEKQATKS